MTIAPQPMVLTTQQAADLLAVSHPTLIKLLNEKQIPDERIGTHRRIQLREPAGLPRPPAERRKYAAPAATASPIGDGEDTEAVLADLREARKVIAQRRRQQRGWQDG